MPRRSTLPQLIAPTVLATIAVYLIFLTWLPSRQDLLPEEAVVSAITPQRNTWFELVLTTGSGSRLTCRTRRGWPPFGPSRCPIEALEPLLGQKVMVLHDGHRPLEIRAGGQLMLNFSAHRKAQVIAWVIAVVLLAFAVWVARMTRRAR